MKVDKMKRVTLVAAVINAVGVFGSTAVAAQADEQVTSGRLEEVVVSAQRRAQSLQDVPISISSFSANQLQASGITDMSGLQTVTPGLVMTTSRGSATPYLRGVGTQFGDPGAIGSIAVYVDGVYYAAPQTGMFSFNNIERVEVIKGPQGTLFGQSTTGGLVHVITKNPEFKPSGSIKVGYGNYETTTLNFYHTTGVSDDLATSLSVVGTHQGDGYGENIFLGEDVNFRREYNIRNKWLWNASDRTEVIASVDYGENSNDTGHVRTVMPGTLGIGATPPTRDGYDTQGNLSSDVDQESYAASIRVMHSFNSFDFTSTTAYHSIESATVFDQDATPIPGVNAIFKEESESFQQEFLFTGATDSLEWTLGGIYYKNDSSAPGFPVQTGGQVGSGVRLEFDGTQDLESYAIFGQATKSLTESTRLTLGARYTSDERSIDAAIKVVAAESIFDPPQAVVAIAEQSKDEESWEEPSWRATLEQDFGEFTMVYISYSRGYKTGQYNLISPANPVVEPETLDAYEVGFKYDSEGGRLRLNGAAFYYDYADIQLFRPAPGGTLIFNAAESEIKGLELESTFLVSSALQLTANLTVIDGEYTDFKNAPAFVNLPQGGNAPVPNFDASGNQILYTPEWAFSLVADYTLTLERYDLDFNITYNRNDEINYAFDEGIKQDAYDLVNARVELLPHQGDWTLSVFGRNLADEEYYRTVSQSGLGNLMSLNPPRTYGVEVGYTW